MFPQFKCQRHCYSSKRKNGKIIKICKYCGDLQVIAGEKEIETVRRWCSNNVEATDALMQFDGSVPNAIEYLRGCAP